jgi:hypothetical protein
MWLLPIPRAALLAAAILLLSCRHNRRLHKTDVDMEQNATLERFPLDSVFLHFEKTWKKFIDTSAELQKPILERETVVWAPHVRSDCQYSAALGHNIPVVQLIWNEPPPAGMGAEPSVAAKAVRTADESNLRFDMSLMYKGFERNYYTTAFPVKVKQRFNIPVRSAFTQDSAAVTLMGPSGLPQVSDLKQIIVKIHDTTLVQKTLTLMELGPGASYKIRKVVLNGQNWVPSQEFVFSIPICPMD